MRKTFVLDTSVLIHDPTAIFRFEDNKVVIPLEVLLELDNLKSQYGIVGYNARQVINLLDELLENNNFPVEGGELSILSSSLSENKKEKNDIKIISRCVDLQKKEKDNVIILVTKDANMRVIARSVGVKVEDYRNDTTRDLPNDVTVIETSKENIDELYKEKVININYSKGCYIFKHGSSSALAYSDSKQLYLINQKVYETPYGQLKALDAYQNFLLYMLYNDEIKIVAVIGKTGSGKSYLSIGSGLNQVLSEKYKKLLILKPIVPIGKDLGYLPGDKEEKLAPWLQSYIDNLEILVNDPDYFSQHIEVEALTYLRGRSLAQRFILVDEAQNLTPQQVKTILSRVGENSKIVFLGDINQIDSPYLTKFSNGLSYIISRLYNEKCFGYIALRTTYRSEVARLAEEL